MNSITDLQDRILDLLDNPYAGAQRDSWRHPQSRYSSNCFGTTLFVLGVTNSHRPEFIPSWDMKPILDNNYQCQNKEAEYDIAAFYANDLRLVHTGVILPSKRIFHQSGYGGYFRIDDTETIRAAFSEIFNEEIFIQYHRE